MPGGVDGVLGAGAGVRGGAPIGVPLLPLLPPWNICRKLKRDCDGPAGTLGAGGGDVGAGVGGTYSVPLLLLLRGRFGSLKK